MVATNWWTIAKTLEVSDINGTLVLKQDEIQENLLNIFSRKIARDEENGVNITLFDTKRKEYIETTMKKSATGDEFYIKWEAEGKGYVVEDEIVMRWSQKKEHLTYKVLEIAPSRTYPEISCCSSSQKKSFTNC